MANLDSLWQQIVCRRSNRLGLPRLEHIFLPRPKLLRDALGEDLMWLVGPPKIGKTLLSHYLAYSRAIGKATRFDEDVYLYFEGATDCLRALDLLQEMAMPSLAALILDDPLGHADPAVDVVFVERLGALRDSCSGLKIIINSRARAFLSLEKLLPSSLAIRTPATFDEWYDPDELLLHFSSAVPTLTRELAAILACPALVLQYRDHRVLPGSPDERSATRRRYDIVLDDITLDKLGLLESDEELALLAMILRLQEYSFSLPTVDEVDALLGRPICEARRAGLVASMFEFDGEARLRFEHSTTRDATNLLLKREVAENLPRLGDLLASGRSRWLEHAFGLWQAEELAASGDWAAFDSTDEAVVAEIAAQVLAVSGGSDSALSRIKDLDLDLWTAQDVAYELAARWSHYSKSDAARALVGQIANDRAALGAYAILEALLYVRGREVADLWRVVDQSYEAVVSAGPPWPREILLAIDALAWRWPPEWRVHSDWSCRFLEKLTRTDAAWALIRFLCGYHPDGLRHLVQICPQFGESVRSDAGVEWTKAQAEVALWLVRWHFVHQCRARARLAHQPWLPQQFLCRSFHPAVVDPNRDRCVARLIASVSAAPSGAGWGLFLGENVRAVDPTGFGDESLEAVRNSLARAERQDVGIIATVLTYAPEESLVDSILRHFSDPVAQECLFRSMVDGLVVDGVRLVEPRFSFRRSLASVYRSCGIQWPRLKAFLPAQDLFDDHLEFDVEGLVKRIEQAGRRHAFSTDPFLSGFVGILLHRVRNGDLRLLDPLEHRDLPRGTETDPYMLLFESAIARLADVSRESKSE